MDAVDPEIQRMVALFEANPSGPPPAPAPSGSSSQDESSHDSLPGLSALGESGSTHNPLLDASPDEDVSNWRAAAAGFPPEEREQLEEEIAEYYASVGIEPEPDAPLLPPLEEDAPEEPSMDSDQPEDLGPDQLLIPAPPEEPEALVSVAEPVGPEFPELALEEPEEPEPLEPAPRFAELAPHDPDSGQAEAIVEPPELTEEEEQELLAIEEVFANEAEPVPADQDEPGITPGDFSSALPAIVPVSTAAAPTAAVVEPAEPEPSPEPEPEPEPATAQVRPEPRDPLRPRRLALLGAGAFVAVVVAFLIVGPPPGTLPGSTPGAGPQRDSQAALPAGSGQDRVASALEAAQTWKERNGGFAGFTHPGAFVAASETQVIITAAGSDGCWNGAVLDSGVKDPRPASDPAACSETGIAQAREVLSTSIAQNKMNDTLVASQALSEAADSARFFAARNYVGGLPSFAGLPPLPQEGVEATVIENGAALRLVSRTGGCVSMIVRVEPGADTASRC